MLEQLKEYKEVLTIVVFFLGGVFWIQKQYPTKTDLQSEIGVLQCLVDRYMALTQLQIHGRDLERQAQDLKSEIQAFSADQQNTKLPVSPGMIDALNEKKSQLAELQADLKNNTESTQKANDELERNVCGRIPQ